MQVKDLVEKLSKFDPELEVSISDGYDCSFYHTKNIEISLFEDNGITTVDIGIGGNKL